MADTYGMVLQSDRDTAIVLDTLQRFSQATVWRNNFAMQWEEVASLVLPAFRNSFTYGNGDFPGMKKTELQVDASGMMALHRFAAICDSLLTPRNSMWHNLSANNDYVMKDRATQLWFSQVNRLLFRYRYEPNANFSSQNQANFQQLGAFGTMGMFIDRFYSNTGTVGLRYRSMPVGELFLFENHQGRVDEYIRWFKLTAAQAFKQFPNTFPEVLRQPMEQGSLTRFDFLQHVYPNKDYSPEYRDRRGMPYHSCYISISGKALLEEGGYSSFPSAISRYDQAPGEVYGRGPAMIVLPALKTLNAEKRTFLKQGHRAADPVLLTADDGLVDFSMRPGALNKGGMTGDGKPLVGILPTGSIQISKEMMDEEKGLINDAFLVSLFQILEETPQMSATEVIERVNEKGILIAPTMGRQQSEYLGTMIDREVDLLAEERLLPPMPPRLREAHGEYAVVYTSPLSKAMRAQEVSGFFRVVQSVGEMVNITQDSSPLDNFDFDAAIPAIADQQAVPPEWMASPDQIAAKRKARANAAQQQAQIQALPAQAAMLKAQNTIGKNGNGTLAAPAQQQPQNQPV